MDNGHLIGKQVMELEIRDSKNSYALQQRVSDLVWNALVPEMERLFDRLVAPDEIVRLSRLELDLGVISLEKKEMKDLVARIIGLMEARCTEAIQRTTREDRTSRTERLRPVHQPIRGHHFNLWLYWLEHGSLPPYAVAPRPDWLNGVLETLALEDGAIEQLRSLAKDRPLVLHRLVLQHDLEILKSLVELYTGHSQTDLPDFFRELRSWRAGWRAKARQPAWRTLETELWKSVFQQVVLRRAKPSGSDLMQTLVRHPELWPYKSEFIGKPKRYAQRYPLLFKTFQKIKEDDEGNENRVPAHRPGSQIKEKGPATPRTEVRESMDDLVVPQFLSHAGMVLLHPLLKRFFEKLGLLEDTGFKDFERQCRAVLLLHDLAGGGEKTADYALVLPKFLCGMPVNLPIDHTLRLTAFEKDEGTQLLQAVIDHWGVLGNTSPDGLREGFLQREGKLIREAAGWKLFVEQKALDVLLDRLPWNLGLVKLPWMKELLYVEWR
ncbi:contractile injection system tape measure protein [Pricia sp. S334]|uniref:Contractile injection system tape measure protein n=1 Tax=Pricia mediterranea TaxID=3076079 RepID=A0ABU3L3N9_9FLAO|nr:contractile injection system tape measure protein [Pricia sp. S334]MDT7828240.1 contractile injection system tape measure protein [Pricia sp. S334]